MKLYPKGNEYHAMFYGERRIVYRWELVEERYQTKELVSS